MILDEIIENKRQELNLIKSDKFLKLFSGDSVQIICEVKLKSPTCKTGFGVDVSSLLADYKAQADAISVVTDNKYFDGDLGLLEQARKTGLPVLRKDFIIEPSQIAEASTDALLLIARILEPSKLKRLVSACLAVGIEPVVEVYSEDELAAVTDTDVRIIAVNSRDLDRQVIDLDSACKLLSEIPGNYTRLLFSGIETASDVAKASEAGADGVLVGTSVLKSNNKQEFINELRGENV